MFGIGVGELLVIGIVGVLLFGGRLPEIAHKAGVIFRKVRRTLQSIQADIEEHINR